LKFTDEGAKVAIPDIIFENAQKVAKEIEAKGGQALALHTDVSDEVSTKEMAKKTLERFGKIDILVNNAAFYGSIALKPFYEITVEEWDELMGVNLRGLFLCCKAVFPIMKEQGKGKIINIASNVFFAGAPYFTHYVTSKGGVIAFTRAVARELGEYQINVNAVAPGLTETEAARFVNPKEIWGMVQAETCLKRAEQPEDLVGVIVFLSSEESDYITGQTIAVDGGYVMH
jgi:3-oxoacyl-[acyl-carrier protein] reductase